MFSKLKDKLKGALSVFSKKTEEVAQEEVDKVIEESQKKEKVVEKPVKEKVIEKEKVAEEKEEEFIEKEVSEESVVEIEEEPILEKKEVIEEEQPTEKEEKVIEEKELVEEEVSEEAGEELEPIIEEEPKEEVIEPVLEEVKVPKTAEQLVEETKKRFDREVAEAELKEVKDKAARTDTLEEAKEKFPEPVVEVKKTEELVEETKKKYDQEVAIEELKDVKDKEELPATEDLVEESKEYQDPDHKFAENIVEETESAKEEYFAEEELVKEEPKKKSFFGKLKKSLFGSETTTEDKIEVLEESEEKVELVESKEEEAQEQPKSFFGKIKKSLTTKTIDAEKFDELFWELELVLLENNVSVEVIDKIKDDLKEELVDKQLPRDVPAKIQETLRNTLGTILTHDKVDLLKAVKEKEGPLIIALFGINGTGKTTSVAKLTKFFQNNHHSVVLAACDTFRAAAIQQLGEHAEKLGVKMISHDYGSDAAAVAFDAIKYAEKSNIDVVLIDTAGRLHSNANLMAELEKIIRVTTPDLKIFVGESITGNDCIEQAKQFNDLVEMDGAILTKADVDEKGGAPLSISYTIKKPILFLGVGQEYQDLEEFDKKLILERLGF
jgi:fused signal recognition particle receptor